MSAYFITSTGTGIGKTFVTCALLHAARQRGIPARGFKPIISGWNDTADMDTLQIIAADGSDALVDDVSPWRFAAPLSPHRAAALEGKVVDTDALEAWCHQQMQREQLSLIEGAGGVMVPITDDYTMLDLMAALNLPVILVVGSYLGTISHTLSTLAVLRAHTLQVASLVINESDGSAVTLAETVAGLSTFISDIPLRIVQPRVSSWQEASAIHALELP